MRASKILLLVFVIFLSITLVACKNPFKSEEIIEEDMDDGAELEDLDKEDLAQNTSPVSVEMREIKVYYIDRDGYVVPVIRQIAKVEGIAKETMKALIDTRANREELLPNGLFPTLPEDTTFELNIKQNEKLAIVNFSSQFLNYNTKEQEQAIVTSIVYTLTEFDTVDKVQIWVEGKVLEKLPMGTKVDKPLTRNDVSKVSKTSSITLPFVAPVAAENVQNSDSVVTVYFYKVDNKGKSEFVAVKKDIKPLRADLKAALNELMKGPEKNSGLMFEIPQETKILSVHVNDSVAYINFSKEILELEDAQKQQNVSKAIAYTAKEFSGLKGVTLLVEGEGLVFMPVFFNQL